MSLPKNSLAHFIFFYPGWVFSIVNINLYQSPGSISFLSALGTTYIGENEIPAPPLIVHVKFNVVYIINCALVTSISILSFVHLHLYFLQQNYGNAWDITMWSNLIVPSIKSFRGMFKFSECVSLRFTTTSPSVRFLRSKFSGNVASHEYEYSQ